MNAKVGKHWTPAGVWPFNVTQKNVAAGEDCWTAESSGEAGPQRGLSSPSCTPAAPLDLAGPVKTETSRCPQFTFPAGVCGRKGPRFLDSFNDSPIWPFAFSGHQSPPPPPSLCPAFSWTVQGSSPPLLSVGRGGGKVPETELLI